MSFSLPTDRDNCGDLRPEATKPFIGNIYRATALQWRDHACKSFGSFNFPTKIPFAFSVLQPNCSFWKTLPSCFKFPISHVGRTCQKYGKLLSWIFLNMKIKSLIVRAEFETSLKPYWNSTRRLLKYFIYFFLWNFKPIKHFFFIAIFVTILNLFPVCFRR